MVTGLEESRLVWRTMVNQKNHATNNWTITWRYDVRYGKIQPHDHS